MNYQIAGEHLRYQRKRTDLNETTKSKQLETQIFSILSTKQNNKIALPHIVQNFQYSGLDSNDIKYVVKTAKFPARMANIFNGDYVEIYAGFSSYLTGVNPTDSSVWTNKYLVSTLPEDQSTYTGVKIYFNTGGQDKVMMNALEIVDNLNEALRQTVSVYYQVLYTTYVYGGLPSAVFATQFYYDLNVYALFAKMQFVFDDYSGKLGMEAITADGILLPLYEIPASVNIVYDDTGASTYMLPQGDWGSTEASYDLAAIQVQVHPGRDLLEHRQFRLAQILGGDLSKFEYSLGKLCGSYTEIHSFGKTIATVEWDTDSRGTYPTEFTFTGTNLMDVVPIKQVYVHAGLNSNMWGQSGSKQQYVYVHQMNNTYQDNPRHFEASTEYFSAKENIQGLRNGFDVIIKDEYGMDPCFMDQYYLEFAFRFHN